MKIIYFILYIHLFYFISYQSDDDRVSANGEWTIVYDILYCIINDPMCNTFSFVYNIILYIEN